MKINYACVSRSLIALLFVVAGVQKVMSFSGITGFVGSLPGFAGLGSPMIATIATVLVIIIEIPVALAFAWGYRICTTGMILIGFTVLATILVHNNLPADMVMVLKNIAIIGGILAATSSCNCGKCPMGKMCKDCKKCDNCVAK
jgi:putative oxidoreductase